MELDMEARERMNPSLGNAKEYFREFFDSNRGARFTRSGEGTARLENVLTRLPGMESDEMAALVPVTCIKAP